MKIIKLPFNIILDRIIPLCAIFFPTIFIILLNPDNTSWFEKFGYVILIHLFILIPLMHYWSIHRSWNTQDTLAYHSWNHPRLYKHMSIALLYPAIFGIYFCYLRFLRLGDQFDILQLLKTVITPENIIILLFILSVWWITILVWSIIILCILLIIQQRLWLYFSIIIYSLHLNFLKYNPYVKCMHKLYKLHFIFFNLVSLNAPVNFENYDNYNIFRRILHNLYYGYYTLFFMPLIFISFKGLNALGRTLFIQDVCRIDYLNLDLTNLRYERVFWIYLEDPNTFYGFTLDIPTNIYNIWQERYNNNYEKYKLYSYKFLTRLNVKMNKLQEKHPKKIYIYFLRIKASYHKTFRIRWDHTIK